MTVDIWEHAARHFEPPRRRWATPGDLAKHINPATVQTPALDLIDEALVRVANTPDSRLIISMPPQEGKSTRAAGDFPAWLLTQNPDLRIVAASYGQSLANRNGRAIRRRITSNPDLGLKIAPDNGAVHEWEIDSHQGGVFSVGVGGGVTGRAADLLIIDDPIKDRAQADSETYRNHVWDWWTDAAAARLAPGAPVILILTRWHHDDLAGRLLERDADAGWEVLNIPAQCVDPKTDPLGRAEGEFMVSARGRSQKQWEQRKKTAGSRTWASLYQGNPTPDTGNLFPADQWARYDLPLWIDKDGARIVPDVGRDDEVELIQSWDCAFKALDTSDYVVGQVWLRRGAMLYLLDQVRRRMTFSETCQAMRDLTARWPQAVAKLVEDKANGTAVMDALHSTVGGLIAVEPVGSKFARAAAITPLVESKNVVLPDSALCPWVSDLTEEARDFPSGSHDDTVDAMSQAVHRLALMQVVDAGDRDVDGVLDEYDDEPLDWALDYA